MIMLMVVKDRRGALWVRHRCTARSRRRNPKLGIWHTDGEEYINAKGRQTSDKKRPLNSLKL